MRKRRRTRSCGRKAIASRGGAIVIFGFRQIIQFDARRHAERAQTSPSVEEGEGIARDMTAAARLYRIAAAKGNAVAQNSWGRMYQYGLGVDQDERRAST